MLKMIGIIDRKKKSGWTIKSLTKKLEYFKEINYIVNYCYKLGIFILFFIIQLLI